VEDGIRGVPHRLRVLKVKAYVEWRKPTCSLQGACCSVPISWRRAWGPIIPQGPLTHSNLRWRVSTVNTGNLERVTDGARTRDLLLSHNPNSPFCRHRISRPKTSDLQRFRARQSLRRVPLYTTLYRHYCCHYCCQTNLASRYSFSSTPTVAPLS
jgi:hypothetical protein